MFRVARRLVRLGRHTNNDALGRSSSIANSVSRSGTTHNLSNSSVDFLGGGIFDEKVTGEDAADWVI